MIFGKHNILIKYNSNKAVEKKEAFIQAIQQNERLIYKIASIYTDNKDDRDDLVQEIIYNLWKSFDSFKQASSFSTWLYRVAMNVSVYHLNKQKKQVTVLPITDNALHIPDKAVNDMDEKLLWLQKQVQHLNLVERGVLLLYLENKSHEEIAQVTGLSKTNVGTKLQRIKEKLSKHIEK